MFINLDGKDSNGYDKSMSASLRVLVLPGVPSSSSLGIGVLPLLDCPSSLSYNHSRKGSAVAVLVTAKIGASNVHAAFVVCEGCGQHVEVDSLSSREKEEGSTGGRRAGVTLQRRDKRFGKRGRM